MNIQEEFTVKQKLSTIVRNGLGEFDKLNWSYGKITSDLKMLYLLNSLDDILNFAIEIKHNKKNKEYLLINPEVFLERINNAKKTLNELNPSSLTKINIFNQKLINYKFFTFYWNDKLEKTEYEDLVKECNPVYTILVNRHKTKILKKFPLDLIRYLNDFL